MLQCPLTDPRLAVDHHPYHQAELMMLQCTNQQLVVMQRYKLTTHCQIHTATPIDIPNTQTCITLYGAAPAVHLQYMMMMMMIYHSLCTNTNYSAWSSYRASGC